MLLIALLACAPHEAKDSEEPAHHDSSGLTLDSPGDSCPSVEEVCDGVDNDCDGEIDEGVMLSFWLDGDGDGYGAGEEVLACETPEGGVAQAGDCDDEDATSFPQDEESLCDGADNDCDGEIDEGLLSTWYLDEDGDGHAGEGSLEACEGEFSEATDRDDADPTVHPDVQDSCDGVDSDCDGSIDEDHEDDMILVTMNGRASFEIDPSTALVSEIAEINVKQNPSSADLSDDGLAIVTYPTYESIAEVDICSGTSVDIGGGEAKTGGMAFDDTGKLWGIRASDDVLLSIDTSTGVASEVGSLGFDLDFNGMAWDCTDQVMWGLDEDEGLFQIDRATGATSGFVPVSLSFSVVGIEYEPSSQQFLVRTGPQLYRVDKNTGNATLVGTYDELSNVNDLAWFPECP